MRTNRCSCGAPLPAIPGPVRCAYCGATHTQAAPWATPPSSSSSGLTTLLFAGGCGLIVLFGAAAGIGLLWFASARDAAPSAVAPTAPIAPVGPIAPVAPLPPVAAPSASRQGGDPGAEMDERIRQAFGGTPPASATPPAEAPPRFTSVACLLRDASGDGVQEIGGLITRGREQGGRLAMIDGATGAVLWETAPLDGSSLRPICLGPNHLGAVDQRAFELIVIPTSGIEGEARRALSDEVDRFGVGRDCVTVRTRDRQTLGIALDDASDARCSARATVRPHISEEVTIGHVHGIISTIRRPVASEHGGARYELRTRRPGTPFLEVTARQQGRERWTRPLTLVPVGGEAIGYLALAAEPGGVVVAGSAPGRRLGSSDVRLVGLDAATGAERFSTTASGSSIVGMFYNGRHVVVATRTALVALSPDTGQIAWQL